MKIQSSVANPIHVSEPDGLAISRGLVPGQRVIHKFGRAPDFDTGDGQVTLWDGANDAGVNLMQYTYSTTTDITRLSSSSAGDTQRIEIEGLDKNLQYVVQYKTLTGQTPVVLDTALRRVFGLRNRGATSIAGTVYCFVNVATTAGVPNTLVNIRAMISPTYNRSAMALTTVPLNHKGYLTTFFANLAGAKKTADYSIKVRARPLGEVFSIVFESAISDGDGHTQSNYTVPARFEAGTDIEMTAEILTTAVTQATIVGGTEFILVRD